MLAPLRQFLDPFCALLDEDLHGRRITQPIARVERVLQMNQDFVLVAQPGGFALRITCLEIRDFPLGHHEHTPALGQFDGGAQSSNVRTNDYEIGLGS